MWSEELRNTTREMLDSYDFVPIYTLKRTQGKPALGLALKRQGSPDDVRGGYVLATEVSQGKLLVRHYDDGSVLEEFDSVSALIDAGWAVD